jgi:alpha-D-xyloside xylohydrolase
MRFKGVKISLKKGQRVAFKLEYYQGTGGRGLRLGWRTPSQLAAGPAPVDNTVETYLPEGADWYDFWTNQRHTGGRRVTTACPLDRFPLFVRTGSIVPMSPAMQYVTEKPSASYEIRVYPGADATFTLYEDDGETYAYEKGRRATVELRWDEKAKTLSIGQRQGSFPGMVAEREFRVVLASETAGVGLPESTDTRSVRYDGRALQIKL